MKKHVWLTILALVMMIVLGSVITAQAEIIPPYGQGQIGLSAVVLCEDLTLRQAPGANAGVLDTLHDGARIIVSEQKDGWAHIFTGDSEDSAEGWVKADYLAIDPAWFKADSATPVYAWNDTSALKVGLLDKDTVLPILKDDGEWLVVGLRGASGWIHK